MRTLPEVFGDWKSSRLFVLGSWLLNVSATCEVSHRDGSG